MSCAVKAFIKKKYKTLSVKAAPHIGGVLWGIRDYHAYITLLHGTPRTKILPCLWRPPLQFWSRFSITHFYRFSVFFVRQWFHVDTASYKTNEDPRPIIFWLYWLAPDLASYRQQYCGGSTSARSLLKRDTNTTIIFVIDFTSQ